VAWRLAKSVEETINQILMRSVTGEIVNSKTSNIYSVKLLRDPIF